MTTELHNFFWLQLLFLSSCAAARSSWWSLARAGLTAALEPACLNPIPLIQPLYP